MGFYYYKRFGGTCPLSQLVKLVQDFIPNTEITFEEHVGFEISYIANGEK